MDASNMLTLLDMGATLIVGEQVMRTQQHYNSVHVSKLFQVRHYCSGVLPYGIQYTYPPGMQAILITGDQVMRPQQYRNSTVGLDKDLGKS
jgi:hypothetical protein